MGVVLSGVALRRGSHEPEFSPFLAYRKHLHAALHRVQDAVGLAPQSDWTVPRMADVAQAAETAGLSSDTQLRRAWHQFGLGSHRLVHLVAGEGRVLMVRVEGLMLNAEPRRSLNSSDAIFHIPRPPKMRHDFY